MRPISFGKYYLLERVNRGGMADIFKAKAFGIEGFERIVAVKKILPDIAEDTEFIRMFIDEAKIAGQLNHANIAQIFDLGRVDGAYFIALEYISGRDLKAISERASDEDEPLSIPFACHVVSKVCDGLDYAHNKSDASGDPLHIVHRDVSPQNVLISYEGEVKLIDFGVAKAAGSSAQTQVGILKGKLSYMSPEQVRGLHLDRRSDIFSAGIVLYELLTGERLFLGDSDFDTLERIRKVEVTPPSLLNPEIPEELEQIVLKALAKVPAERYQTAHELQEALQRFMFNEGVYFTNKDLRAKMSKLFGAEIARERAKLEEYRALSLESLEAVPAAPPGSGTPGLSWDEEEIETTVFDREEDEEPPAFTPPDDDVVWADDEVSGEVGDAQAPQEEHEPEEHEPAPTKPLAPVGKAQLLEASDEPQVPRLPAAPPPARRERSGSGAAWVLAVAAIALLFIAGYWFLRTPDNAALRLTVLPDGTEFTVSIDGETPIAADGTHAVAGLEPGTHEIRVEAAGFEPIERDVELAAGSTHGLQWQLEPLPPTTSLAISSDPPGARVLVDGEPVGETPTELSDLRIGDEIALRLERDGHEPIEQTLTVAAEMEPLSPKLTALTTDLRITSDPEGARWTVAAAGGENEDAEPIGQGETPGELEGLERGAEYVAKFTLDGHQEVSLPVAIGDNPLQSVHATLREIPEPEPDPQPTARRTERRERSEAERREPDTHAEARPERTAERPSARQQQEPEARTPQRTEEPPQRAERTATAPSTAPPPQQPPPSRMPPQQAQAPPQQAASAEPARLNVQSRPAARVIIDGQDTGRFTPLINYEVPPGRHRIELINEDFGLHRVFSVDLAPGRSRTLLNTQ